MVPVGQQEALHDSQQIPTGELSQAAATQDWASGTASHLLHPVCLGLGSLPPNRQPCRSPLLAQALAHPALSSGVAVNQAMVEEQLTADAGDHLVCQGELGPQPIDFPGLSLTLSAVEGRCRCWWYLEAASIGHLTFLSSGRASLALAEQRELFGRAQGLWPTTVALMPVLEALAASVVEQAKTQPRCCLDSQELPEACRLFFSSALASLALVEQTQQLACGQRRSEGIRTKPQRMMISHHCPCLAACLPVYANGKENLAAAERQRLCRVRKAARQQGLSNAAAMLQLTMRAKEEQQDCLEIEG